MYEAYYGFREKPFNLTPDPKFLYLSGKHHEAFAHLEFGLEQRGGFMVITGEVGTGKTTLCRYFLDRLDERTVSAFILYPALGTTELLRSINRDLGILSDCETDKELIDTLHQFLLESRGADKNIVLVIALLNIPIYVRLVRSQVLSLRERTFVEAGKAAGTTELNVAFRHVLPNGLSPALAQVPITIGFAILITAGLSFIGAGVQPPTPEWGAMVASGAEGIIIGEWWTSFFPGVAISLTVFGFAVAGEALRAVFLREV